MLKDKVFKNVALAYLPDFKSNMADVIKLTNFLVFFVFWIVYLWVDPFTFISRVVYLLWLPLTLGISKMFKNI